MQKVQGVHRKPEHSRGEFGSDVGDVRSLASSRLLASAEEGPVSHRFVFRLQSLLIQ